VGRRPAWQRCTTQELLDWRLCDLDLSIEGTGLEPITERLLEELEDCDLRVRPHFWLGEEWFSPEGVPGISLPFFLAHPLLTRLERQQMLSVEGAGRGECLRLLRHECGHAVQHAYQLQRRRRWQELFGSTRQPYPEAYRPNPASRRYVVHLPNWYAQAHPDEDFAETFALWLTPGSGWRRRYKGWPALRKLEYVDELMAELAGKRPAVRSRARVDPVSGIRTTLREHYAAKRERYQILPTNIYDDDLMRFFRAPGKRERSSGEAASAFLRRHRAEIRRRVARATGKHELALDMVLGEMIARCRTLGLRTRGGTSLVIDFAILMAARSVEYVYHGRDWHAL
jgi:hypothetical protein